MSANANVVEGDGASPEWVHAAAIRDLPIDQGRGTQAMAWFIVSESMVFAALFFSYFYLGHLQPQWPVGDPPHLAIPVAMDFILVVSCVVLWIGGWLLRRGQSLAARVAILITILLGCGFLVLNSYDYDAHARVLAPDTNSYTSIFYVIEGVHAAHLILGLLFLVYAGALPRLGVTEKPPHGAYRNASMYWYFVTAAWLAVFAVLFIGPHHPVGVFPGHH